MSANAFAIALGNRDKNPTIRAVAQAIPDKILEKAIPQTASKAIPHGQELPDKYGKSLAL